MYGGRLDETLLAPVLRDSIADHLVAQWWAWDFELHYALTETVLPKTRTAN